jgi:hypothetical protein
MIISSRIHFSLVYHKKRKGKRAEEKKTGKEPRPVEGQGKLCYTGGAE